jgi:hypothetical protein
LIESRLDEMAELESVGNTDELNRIRSDAPRAIPGPLMRTLWRLLLAGRVKSWARDFNLHRWRDRLKRDGLTTTLRLELHDILTPRVSLREPFRVTEGQDVSTEPQRLKDLVEWDVVLSMDHVHSGLAGLSGDQHWIEALPDLLAGFGGLLRDALDLMREMGGAEDRSDMSYMHQPSISEHPQNRHFHDWTALIDLSRDAWLAMAARSPERARLAAEGWWQVPYPLFRRLAFFAAAQGDHIAPHRALDWLLADNGWWLWSVETERETMRLLVVLAPKLDATSLAELEQAILAGPPREMFKGDIQDEDWSQIVAREIWLRLAKTAKAAVLLGPTAKKRLDALSAQYPEWQLATLSGQLFHHRMCPNCYGSGRYLAARPLAGRPSSLVGRGTYPAIVAIHGAGAGQCLQRGDAVNCPQRQLVATGHCQDISRSRGSVSSALPSHPDAGTSGWRSN